MSCTVRKNSDLNEIKSKCINGIPVYMNVVISMKMAITENMAEKFDIIYDLIKEQKLFAVFVDDVKDDGASDRLRQQGNKKFQKGKKKEAHEIYTKCLALATPGSESIALAYGNRSAVLFESKYYEECIADIDRALSENYPEKFKSELEDRKEEAAKLMENNKRPPIYEEIPEMPENALNKKVKGASNGIKVTRNKKYGRHIVATRELNVGEIVANKIPQVKVLTKHKYLHCHHCLKPCFNTIPCTKCTQELYCSVNCRTIAATEYHDIECAILATMNDLDFDEEVRLALRTLLKVRNDLEKYKTETDQVYDDSFQGVFQLQSHHNKRDNSQIFNQIIEAVIIYDILHKHTELFKGSLKSKLNIFKEMLLHMMEVVVINKGRVSVLAENKKADIYDDDIIGYDLSSLFGLLNHSCNPNVLVISHGPAKIIRIVQTIKPGEQLAINYCAHYSTTPKLERQFTLQQEYFFSCTCIPCTNNWPLVTKLSAKKIRLHLDLQRVRTPDVQEAEAVLKKWLPKIKEIESEAPSLSSFDIQEIVKQCYTIFGNKIITF